MKPLVEFKSGGWPPAAAAISFVARPSFSGANSTVILGYLARRPAEISPPTSLSNGNIGLPQTVSLALMAAGDVGAPPSPPPTPQATAAAPAAADPMAMRRVCLFKLISRFLRPSSYGHKPRHRIVRLAEW